MAVFWMLGAGGFYEIELPECEKENRSEDKQVWYFREVSLLGR